MNRKILKMMKNMILKWLTAVIVITPSVLAAQSVDQAKKLWDSGLKQQAKKIFVDAAKNSPASAINQYYAGNAYLDLAKQDSAWMYFEKGIAADQSVAHNYIGKGRVYLDNGKLEDAKTYFLSAQSKAKKSAEVAMLIGMAWMKSKNANMDEAMKMFEKAKEINSKYAPVYIAIGDWHLQKNSDGGQANNNYELALDFEPGNCLATYKIADVYFKNNNYAVAETYLSQLFSSCSDFAIGLQLMGETEFMLQKYAEAKDYYQRYLDIIGSDIEAEKRMASILFVAKDFEGAINMANKILLKDPKNYVAKRILGFSTFEAGDDVKALGIMNDYFETVNDSNHVPLDYEYMGKIFAKQKSDSLAIVYLKEAVKRDSSKADVYDLLAKSFLNLKQYAQAAHAYEKKLGLPDYTGTPTDYWQLGVSYYSSGAGFQAKAVGADSLVNAQLATADYSLADSAFKKVSELLPTAVIGFFWRARTHAAMDPNATADNAKTFYEKVIENSAGDMVKFKKELLETYQYLGYYYYKRDNCKVSVENWKKVLEIDPANVPAKDAIEALKDCKA